MSEQPGQRFVRTSRHGLLPVAVTLAGPAAVTLADPADVDAPAGETGLAWSARLEDPPDALRHVRAGYGQTGQDALDALQWACERASGGAGK